MQPFYIILFFLITISFLDLVHIPKDMKVFLITGIGCILVGFAAFRYDNPDWRVYYDEYLAASRGVFFVSPDIGFNIMVRILSAICKNPIIMFFVMALISVCLNVNSFYRYTPYVFSCILLYFSHNYVLKEMIQIRAGLVSAICLFSMRYLIYKDDPKKFIIAWLIAVSVHLSAVVFGLPYIVYKVRPKRATICWIVVACFVVGAFSPLGVLIKKFASAVEIGGRMADYVAYGDSGFAGNLGLWTNINTVKSLMIFVFCSVYSEKLSKRYKAFDMIYYSYFVGLCWLVVFSDFAIIGARISNLLFSGEPILLTMLFSLFTRRTRIIYLATIICIALMVFRYNIAPDKVVPYKFYFTQNFK